MHKSRRLLSMVNRYFSVWYFAFLIFAGLLFLLSDCSNQKNTFMSRAWHNVNARYNVFHNGREYYKKGVESIRKNYQEDYTHILPIFPFSDKDAVSSAMSSMDNTIQKSAKLIKKHSITTKIGIKKSRRQSDPEFYNKPEYNNWVDDAWLMMGKAYFFRHEFFTAIEKLKHVEETYLDNEIIYEAKLWITRSYNEMEDFEKAEKYLIALTEDDKTPKKILGEVYLTYADYYMKQDKYTQAIPMLEKAIPKIQGRRKKNRKARYKFILAQLYRETGNGEKAMTLFQEVINMNPRYEMTFNAKINRALSYSGEGGTQNIIKQLNKMLRDDKNIEYQDQIYYALASIAYKNGNTSDAIDLYKKSVQTSMYNSTQKAMSCLALAEIYFDMPMYQESAAYYDSTMTYLDPGYENYDKLAKKTANLLDLVENLNIVHRQDSLQRVAKMPKAKRMSIIKGIINEIIEEERRQRELEQMRRMSIMDSQDYSQQRNQNNSGKWYFYNPTSLSIGMSEFTKRWGRRKLEDNWRRRNKAVVMNDMTGDDTQNADSLKKSGQYTKKDVEYYLQDLPLTDSLMVASHEKIAEALFNVGDIYMSKLKDYDEATAAFEDLLKRYPDNIFLLETYYSLYKINKERHNASLSNYYKTAIIKEFPNSIHAKIFANPNYLKELEAQKKQVEDLYNKALEAYNNENYGSILFYCNNANRDFPENHLKAKFEFLRSMSVGALSKDTTKLVAALEGYIADFPEGETTQEAKTILKIITGSTDEEINAISTTDEEKKEEEIYNFEAETAHYYITAIKNKDIDLNRLKFNIVNFNIDNFQLLDFTTSVVELNKNTPVITVKRFNNKISAETYLSTLEKDDKVYENIDKKDYIHFIISADNFKTFFDNKDISRYLRFYRKHYK